MKAAIGILLTAVVVTGAPRAGAVDIALTGGKMVKLQDKDGAAADQALVKFVKDPALQGDLPSPLCPAASTVRLKTDTHEIIVPLDCAKWSAAGRRGFKYQDKAGISGGVQKVQIASNAKGGKLLIKMKGANYGAIAFAGPAAFVEGELRIGADGWCGRFQNPPAAFNKNDEEKLIAKGSSIACVPPPTTTATITATVTSTATVASTATMTSTATVPLPPTVTPTEAPTATFTPIAAHPPQIVFAPVNGNALVNGATLIFDPNNAVLTLDASPTLDPDSPTDNSGLTFVFSLPGTGRAVPDDGVLLQTSQILAISPLAAFPFAPGQTEIQISVSLVVTKPDPLSTTGGVLSDVFSLAVRFIPAGDENGCIPDCSGNQGSCNSNTTCPIMCIPCDGDDGSG